MKHFFGVILFFSLTLFFNSCLDKKCPEPNPQIKYALSEGNRHWLDSVPNVNEQNAYSNLGGSGSFYLSKNRDFAGYDNKLCREIAGEFRNVAYDCWELNYEFNLSIWRFQEQDRLVLKNSYYSYYGYTSNLTANLFYGQFVMINLEDKNNKVAQVRSRSSNYDEINTTIPYTIIPSLTLNSKTYSDVYKIEFINKNFSLDQKTKAYWISPKHGLIQFEDFNGEIWTFN
jgi:hypothetical protein